MDSPTTISEKQWWVDIYEKLSVPLPDEAVQRASQTDTHKGYDTTGYGYQYCVNKFNEVLGLAGWGYDFEIVNVIQGTFKKSGATNYEVTIAVTIWIKDKQYYRKAIGGHLAASYADAAKGGLTNSFKKTAAFWGVGKVAYEGTLDDDYQDREEGENDRISTTEKVNPLLEKAHILSDKLNLLKPEEKTTDDLDIMSTAQLATAIQYMENRLKEIAMEEMRPKTEITKTTGE